MTLSPTTPQDQLTDRELISRCLGGERAAFNPLVLRHEKRLFRFLLRTASNLHDVEDAIQQAFTQAYTRLQTYNPSFAFTTWLFSIAIRELRALAKKSSRNPALPLDQSADPAAPQSLQPDFDSPGPMWDAARRALTAQQYTTLWLRYAEDLQPRDIAKIIGRPRIWVSVTLSRACATLRKTAQASDRIIQTSPTGVS